MCCSACFHDMPYTTIVVIKASMSITSLSSVGVFADPDTIRVLKMEFLGSWKGQIKEVIVSQRTIIDCNYLVITMLGALQARGPYVNVCITNTPSSML